MECEQQCLTNLETGDECNMAIVGCLSNRYGLNNGAFGFELLLMPENAGGTDKDARAQLSQQLVQHLSEQYLHGESSLRRLHGDANAAEPLTSDLLGETSELVPVCCWDVSG